MKCLFLGYNKKQTKIISILKKKNIIVINKKSKITLNDIKNKDIIISFGYRKIIKQKILSALSRPIINLHMSYLPFNKGAHPNFWSFFDNTKKGVTIHEVDKGIDTGKIIFRKEIKFDTKKRIRHTFKSTYRILFKEIENLFIQNYKPLLSNKYKKKINQKNIGKTHKSKHLPSNIKSWNKSIYLYLKKFNLKIYKQNN